MGDDLAGGYLVARHLVDLGHRRIGIITGPEFTSTGQDRRAGAMRALSEAGVADAATSVFASGYGVEDGIAAARELLGRRNPPSAIFAANDNLAIGVQSAALALGLTPGREVSIVGYNDIPLIQRLPVLLTSVRTPFDQIASNALDMLLTHGGGDRGIHRILPTLIPRASTQRPPS